MGRRLLDATCPGRRFRAEVRGTLSDLARRVDACERDVTDMRSGRMAALEAQVRRLEADLDESRRLNLRAAELLDIVQTHVVMEGPAAGE